MNMSVEMRQTLLFFLVFWPDDTRNLPCGRYIYDVELVRENGYTDTLIPPRPFFLERGVTDNGT